MKYAAVLFDNTQPGYLATKHALIDLGFEVKTYSSSDDFYRAQDSRTADLVVVQANVLGAFDNTYVSCLRENLAIAKIIAVSAQDRISKSMTVKDAMIEMGADAFVHVREPLLAYREKLQLAVSRVFVEAEAASTHQVMFRRTRYGQARREPLFRKATPAYGLSA